MTVHLVPASVALILMLVLLAYALQAPQRSTTTRLFAVLLSLFAAHNLIEILGFSHFARVGFNDSLERYGYAYVATIIPFMAVALHLSLRLSLDRHDVLRGIAPLLYVPVLVLGALLLATDELVAGFELFQGFTLIRIPGPLYYLFETYMVVYSSAALVYLLYGARSSRPSVISRIRNRWWLVGVSPFVLLLFYLVVANHFGEAKISATISLPITLTFFLIVTTYATYQYRLFDISFFLPWSKVRKRKRLFYDRISNTAAAIANLHSVREALDLLANTLRCQVALIGGVRPIVAFAEGAATSRDQRVSSFPRIVLETIDDIVVANEVADDECELYELMQQHHVGAIVPFRSHSGTAGNWMLFGEHFSDAVYTPLDFRKVEALLARIAELFVDDLLLVRAQLADAREEIRFYQQQLAHAWNQLQRERARLSALETQLSALRDEAPRARRAHLRVIRGGRDTTLPAEIAAGNVSLPEHLARLEAHMAREALQMANACTTEAARILGMDDQRALEEILARHGIEPANLT